MAIITGTSDEDWLSGTEDGDEIYGLAGADVLGGGEGDDLLEGGDGDDVLSGDGGDDSLDGGSGVDTVSSGGRPTDFTLIRGAGGTYVLADRNAYWGTDTLVGIEYLDFGGYVTALADLAAEGTALADTIEGGSGIDWLFGHGGDDTLRGGAGENLVDGGAGEDTALYSGSSSDYRIFFNPEGLLQVDVVTADGEDVYLLGSDVLIDVEHLYFEGDLIAVDLGDVPALGTSGADTLTGTGRNDFLLGRGGGDLLDGGAGDDWMSGGAGDDVYLLGAGDDYAFDRGQYGDPGGDDLYLYDPGDGDDRISDEGGFDVLEFGTGIDAANVVVEFDLGGQSYIISFTDRAGSVVLEGAASGNPYLEIEEVRFADNSFWTAGDLYDMAAAAAMGSGGGGGFLP